MGLPTSSRPGRRVALATVLLLGASVAHIARAPLAQAQIARAPVAHTQVAHMKRMRSDSVRTVLETRIAQVPGAQVAIAVRDLSSGQRLSIRGDTVYHAASTMKVPVLFALYREFQAKRLQPTQLFPLVNAFTSIVDGSPYALNASDDSDSTVYALVGRNVPLRELAARMITHSSNLATNALITRLEPTRITALAHTFGATRMQVLRGVEDNLAFRAGLNNTTTANDLVALFVALQQGKVANAALTKDMLSILEAQAFNDEIPAGLPAGTRIAHKTGSITGVLHDAGIVYPDRRKPYVIAVLTRGIPDERIARALMKDCSRIVWEWLSR